jgi:hypothetical protein
MPRRAFSSPAYRANVRDLVWYDRAPAVNAGDWYYKVEESTPVYEISRGMFFFSIMEEQGTLRVLALTWSQ